MKTVFRNIYFFFIALATVIVVSIFWKQIIPNNEEDV